jgi:hypothetical protein
MSRSATASMSKYFRWFPSSSAYGSLILVRVPSLDEFILHFLLSTMNKVRWGVIADAVANMRVIEALRRSDASGHWECVA